MKFYLASPVTLYNKKEQKVYEQAVYDRWPDDEYLVAAGYFVNSSHWLGAWPMICEDADGLIFTSDNGFIGRGVWKEVTDIQTLGKPVYFYANGRFYKNWRFNLHDGGKSWTKYMAVTVQMKDIVE